MCEEKRYDLKEVASFGVGSCVYRPVLYLRYNGCSRLLRDRHRLILLWAKAKKRDPSSSWLTSTSPTKHGQTAATAPKWSVTLSSEPRASERDALSQKIAKKEEESPTELRTVQLPKSATNL